MEYSTLKPYEEIGETGIVHDKNSLYGRFHNMSDPRHSRGKIYSLVTLLVVIILAKLAGKDKPDEIADWAKNHAEELAGMLKLERKRMPSHSTIRRVFHSILNEAEFDRIAQEYQQQEQSGGGEVLAMDGKTLRGTRIAGQERSDHVLSIYEVEDQGVLAQEVVDSKENEIVAARFRIAVISLQARSNRLAGSPAADAESAGGLVHHSAGDADGGVLNYHVPPSGRSSSQSAVVRV